jgi:uncharacterized membrane protein
MAKAKKQTKANDDRKVYAFLATFLSIIGFIIAILTKKDDKYVMFYAKQSLVIFIACIIVGVINSILVFIPIIGWAIMALLNLGLLVLWLLSWIYALSEEEKEVPIIGQYASKINL